MNPYDHMDLALLQRCMGVGMDVIDAIKDILQSWRLLKEVNTTTITLIPKVKCPRNVSEYKPIS